MGCTNVFEFGEGYGVENLTECRADGMNDIG
jgi:hypothetical protein